MMQMTHVSKTTIHIAHYKVIHRQAECNLVSIGWLTNLTEFPTY